MKKILTFLMMVISMQMFAQNYPITGINITLPAIPDANTANWGTGTSLIVITANSKGQNGRIDGAVMESRMLVTIKKGGVKFCGSYTEKSAPSCSFNLPTKVWSGTNAVAFLGKDCILASGEYELCVQFFGFGSTGVAPLSEEKCKSFTIQEKEKLVYQQPQAISPADGTNISRQQLKCRLTFDGHLLFPHPGSPSLINYRCGN